ncbi:hypothetical protein ACFXTN_000453 [Malus domestica]
MRPVSNGWTHPKGPGRITSFDHQTLAVQKIGNGRNWQNHTIFWSSEIITEDYFTKWVKAKSYAELTSKEVCDFVEEHIVTRFDVPETIITYNGIVFIAERFKEYTASLKIWLEQSTPYYPQANGQAEVSNKVLIGILEKMIKERPGMWHLKLNEALWVYRTSPRSATGTTPYALTYGHDAMLPVELSVNSLRMIEHSSLSNAEYSQAMLQEL